MLSKHKPRLGAIGRFCLESTDGSTRARPLLVMTTSSRRPVSLLLGALAVLACGACDPSPQDKIRHTQRNLQPVVPPATIACDSTWRIPRDGRLVVSTTGTSTVSESEAWQNCMNDQTLNYLGFACAKDCDGGAGCTMSHVGGQADLPQTCKCTWHALDFAGEYWLSWTCQRHGFLHDDSALTCSACAEASDGGGQLDCGNVDAGNADAASADVYGH